MELASDSKSGASWSLKRVRVQPQEARRSDDPIAENWVVENAQRQRGGTWIRGAASADSPLGENVRQRGREVDDRDVAVEVEERHVQA